MTATAPAEFTELSCALRRYYKRRTVRQRMAEFLGDAEYITATDGVSGYSPPVAPANLPKYMKAGLELDRSLRDKKSLIGDIDLEYHNFDAPAAAWLDPERAFRLQQPVMDATLRVLGQAGIRPLVLVSGRGYHLVWAVRQDSRAFHRLIELGAVETGDPVTRAFAGLGLIIEFVAHGVLQGCAAGSTLPVQLTAIEVGPGIQGREIVSFDLS